MKYMGDAPICDVCKYVDKFNAEANTWKCKSYEHTKEEIDYVKGTVTYRYASCYNWNSDGTCREFERREGDEVV